MFFFGWFYYPQVYIAWAAGHFGLGFWIAASFLYIITCLTRYCSTSLRNVHVWPFQPGLACDMLRERTFSTATLSPDASLWNARNLGVKGCVLQQEKGILQDAPTFRMVMIYDISRKGNDRRWLLGPSNQKWHLNLNTMGLATVIWTKMQAAWHGIMGTTHRKTRNWPRSQNWFPLKRHTVAPSCTYTYCVFYVFTVYILMMCLK